MLLAGGRRYGAAAARGLLLLLPDVAPILADTLDARRPLKPPGASSLSIALIPINSLGGRDG